MHRARQPAIAAGLFVAGMFVAGCSTIPGSPVAASRTTTPVPSSSAPSSGASSSSAPPSSAPPSSAPAPAPSAAADGTNLNACRDGTCEVYVSGTAEIPLPARYGFTRFVVRHLPSARTLVFVEDPADGNLNGYVDGTGSISTGGLTMRIISTDRRGEVLRFGPRKN